MSCPKFLGAISSLLKLVYVTGFFLLARTDVTKTSSSWVTLVVSLDFSCEEEIKEKRKKRIDNRLKSLNFCVFLPLQQSFLNKIFIRKIGLRIKRGNYSY